MRYYVKYGEIGLTSIADLLPWVAMTSRFCHEIGFPYKRPESELQDPLPYGRG